MTVTVGGAAPRRRQAASHCRSRPEVTRLPSPGDRPGRAASVFLESISFERATVWFCERLEADGRTVSLEEHSHPCFEFRILLGGKDRVKARENVAPRSDVVLYPPGLKHFEQLDVERRREAICLWADLGPCAPFDRVLTFIDQYGAFQDLFKLIYLEYTARRPLADELLAFYLRTLVLLIRRHFALESARSAPEVERCLRFTHDHYADDYSITTLANLAEISPSLLFRRFKKRTGLTPVRYRNMVRVNKAKLLLLDRTLPLEEVAERLGFQDKRYFNRVFKQWTGISLREFRKRNSGSSPEEST